MRSREPFHGVARPVGKAVGDRGLKRCRQISRRGLVILGPVIFILGIINFGGQRGVPRSDGCLQA